jgi:hypothetical protein
MKNLFLVVGLMTLACKPLWSLPFAPLSQFSKRHASMSHEKKNIEEAKLDFSGLWEGECNQQRVDDLVIVQNPSSIKLAYGGIKEKYPIGELNLSSSSNKNSSESSSTTVFWNQECNALIFLHSLSFATRDSSSTSVHFSKSSMQLAQSILMIKTQYFRGSNTLSSIQQDTLNCIYHKK